MHERERYARLHEIYLRAKEMADDEARRRYIEDACADDETLRRQASALLRVGRDEPVLTDLLDTIIDQRRAALDSWIDRTSDDGAGLTPSEGGAGALPASIGDYEVTRVIGRGGMGVVYEAQQPSPRRRVAIKIINPGVASPLLLRRFRHESEVLGRLQHPGIAQIYEAGTCDLGGGEQPYFAMEHIEGESLLDYAERRSLGTRERLDLLVRICDAVQHAHQRGVIHRDLKPANILVTADGMPKILDFGVARATDTDMQATTMATDVGALIGTVPYMSPEQASGDANAIDTRSDIYALGVVSYELLTGRLPYDLADKLVHEAVRVIREEEPTALSSLNRALRGDVETIVGKALAKEPARRYPSCAALAGDIQRYLDDEPIAARPPSAAYQLRKFARRNKAIVGGAGATAAALVIGIVVSMVFAIRANEARVEAEASLARAVAAEQDAEQRADELQQVVNFQYNQMLALDTRVIGDRLRETLTAQRLEHVTGTAPDEADALMDQLDASLEGVNFSGLARDLLETSVLKRAFGTIEDTFDDQPLVQAQLMRAVATTANTLGFYEFALEAQRRSLEIFAANLDQDHSKVRGAHHELGEVYSALGRHAEALAEYRIAYDGLMRSPDPLLVDQSTLAYSMGNSLVRQGQLKEAAPMLAEALAGYREVWGDRHQDTRWAMDALASALTKLGRYDEAEPLYREAISLGTEVDGLDHSNTLVALANFGTWMYQRARYDEAAELYQQAYEGFAGAYGEDHPTTITLYGMVGQAMANQPGRLADAEPYLRETLARKREIFGDDHATTLVSINNLASLLKDQGRNEDAEPLYREAYESKRRVLGPSHPSTLISMSNLGFFLTRTERYDEAEPLLREALDRRRDTLGAEHDDTLLSLTNLASLLETTGRHGEAVSLLEASEESARSAYSGSLIQRMGDYLVVYGRALTGASRYEEAETALLEAHPILVEHRGEADERTVACREALAALYERWNEAAPGEGHDFEAEKWRDPGDQTTETGA